MNSTIYLKLLVVLATIAVDQYGTAIMGIAAPLGVGVLSMGIRGRAEVYMISATGSLLVFPVMKKSMIKPRPNIAGDPTDHVYSHGHNLTEIAKDIKQLYASLDRHPDVCSVVRYYNGQTSFKTRERS